VTLAGSAPLDVALPVRKSRILRGRLFDRLTGEGISGVPVRLGELVAITRKDGSFSIEAPASGCHCLIVDPIVLGLDRVVDNPGDIFVDAGEVLMALDLAVVRAAHVSGQMTVKVDGGGDAPVQAVVELLSDKHRIRTSTDREGRFVAHRLVPGNWVIRVVSASLPKRHAFSSTETQVVLEPGEGERVTFEAVPREIRYQFIRRETLAANWITRRRTPAGYVGSPVAISSDASRARSAR
jgi:hypothetical protein